jgi:NADPH:quinone reductase-like Zn-dependent oxidoreductase
LVKVKAASVNPIDVAMSKGYGSEVISSVRKLERGKLPQPFKPTIDFPITLGRDFAGTVVEKGSGVTDVHVGDEVYGVLGFTEHGSHAEYTVARGDLVRKKPQNLTFAEAASIPYVALTCWSALKVSGNYFDFHNKRFLVLGGSGGVGTFAVQYLIANGAKVVTTCSTDAVPQLESYLQGYGIAVDYTQPEVLTLLQSHAPYDCILNVSGPRNDISHYLQLLKPVSGQYLTLSPPLLNNFDQHGFLGGAIKNALAILKENVDSISNNRVVTKWAFFMPSSCGLKEIGGLVDQGQIRPVVEKTFKFADLPLAYERIEAGHLRGKVVVEF